MIKYDRDPIAVLETLKRSLKNKILRKAIRNASNPVKREIKMAAPRRCGALKMSIGNKMKATKGGGIIYNVVGPKRNYIKQWQGKTIKPSRYAHLAERKYHFMTKAVQRSRAGYFAQVRQICDDEIVNSVKGG